MVTSDDEWKRRVLCSDGNCIGVVGADGRCKECGRPYEGELPLPATDAGEADERLDEAAGEQSATQAGDADTGHMPVDAESGDDWETRTLCSDESCIGVIGPDGRCKECGRPYSG